MRNKNIFCSILYMLFVVSGLYAQEKFSKEQLLSDLDFLYESINGIHPDMFAFCPKSIFETELSNVKASLKDSTTIIEFYKQVAPIVAILGDGHTSLYPSHLLKRNKDIPFLFPIEVEVQRKDSSILVKSFYSDSTSTTSIPDSSRIVRINGRTDKEIVGEMMRFVSGEKDFYRITQINTDYLKFPILLYVMYGETDFDIEYLAKDILQHARLKAVLPSQMRATNPARKTKGNYVLSLDEENDIAFIEFNAFSDPKKFQAFMDTTFTLLKEKQIGNLIIDIRENGGGNSAIGDIFFQYISPVPYNQVGKAIIKSGKWFKKNLRKNNPQAYISMFISPDSIYTNEKVNLIPLKENELRYQGDIYLLISNKTFSSASLFSWAFKYFDMGTVIGEETGGLAVHFGDVTSWNLPNTKLSYGVSYKKFYHYGTTEEDAQHGTIPDYEVPADKAMDFAIELIKQKQK